MATGDNWFFDVFSNFFLVAGFLREYTPNASLVRHTTENPRICRFKPSIILRPCFFDRAVAFAFLHVRGVECFIVRASHTTNNAGVCERNK
jgi:hypothetical protein